MKNGGTASPSINISFSENNSVSNAHSFSLACVAGTSWMWYMADTADHPIELELDRKSVV